LGGRDTDLVLLDENGIRCDGRKIDEPRKIMIKAGVLKNADGSAYIEFGNNKTLTGTSSCISHFGILVDKSAAVVA